MTHSEEVLSPDFELFGLKRPGSGAITPPAPPGWEIMSLELSLITPMFGGSAEAGQVDPERPVNAKSIRGHLRFWWRACRAGQFASAEDMFRREAEIWGAAGEYGTDGKPVLGQGAVDLEVAILSEGTVVNARNLIPKASPRTGPQEGIFLFPFDEQKKENKPPADALKNVQFELYLSLSDPAFRQDVQDALIAWILFGGIGARTRRGCGALKPVNPPEWYPADVEALRKWAASLPPSRTACGWTSLAGARAVVGDPAPPLEAWRLLGKYWSAFRKGHIGGNPYNPMTGCKWPDHDVLKRQLGRRDPLGLVKPFIGLPIVYQRFRGSFSGTLEPKDSGRMASPVILKPIAFGNGEVRPAVVVMNAPRPKELKVGEVIFGVEVPKNHPLLQKYGDPLSAVLASAKQLGGVEVRLGGSK